MVRTEQWRVCLWLQITGGLVCEKLWYPNGQIGGNCACQDNNPSQVIKSKFPALRLLFISCFEGDKISPTPKRTNMPCASDSLLISKKWRGVFCYFVSSQTYGGPTLSSFISHPNLVLGHLALNVYLAHLGSIWGSLLWRHQTDICKVYNWPPYSPGFQRRMIRGWKNENALGRGSWECNFHPAYFSRPA